ncbi:outer membrane beta-barrel protein [Mucilaginibacter sp. PAMB04274]|uniref:outer membrane beta-barrel protein n=1 Tax=Mucilaginibacter sp. PAMB04274 TaxID=3138568 RepID=UPI0031F6E1BC
MKKSLLLLAIIAALFCSTIVKAQLLGNNERYSQYSNHINVGIDGFYNMNPGSKTYKPGVGASLKYQYDVTQNLGLTLGVGYFVIPANTTVSRVAALRQDLKLIPLRLGAKAYFLPEFYLGGEVGVAYADPYIDVRTKSHFSKFLAPSVGYETNHLDFSFRYENVNHQDDYVSFIALRIAYTFNF